MTTQVSLWVYKKGVSQVPS